MFWNDSYRLEICLEDKTRRLELKDFLRSRRSALRFESGKRAVSRRRVPGLRREELAEQAGVSVSWYTWLEQGRPIQVSRSALERIATVLQLSPTDRTYFLALAGVEAAAEPPSLADFTVGKPLQAIMDGLTLVPALILGPLFDVMGYNRLANLIFEFENFEGPFAGNHLWRMFMDPTRRELYGDTWEEVASLTVGVFRVRYAQYGGNPTFDALLDSLMMNSSRFTDFWARKHTTPFDTLDVDLKHRQHGRLKVSTVRFRVLPESEFVLATLPAADSRTLEVFETLSVSSPARAMKDPIPMRVRNRPPTASD